MPEDRDDKGAGILLFANDTGNVLIAKRSEEVSKSGTISIPGGHLEMGEDAKEAATREFREETGLDVPLYDVHEVHSSTRHDHAFHTFVAYTPEQPDSITPEPEHAHEHDGFAWVSPAKLMNIKNLHPGFKRTLQNISLQRLAKQAQKKRQIDERLQKMLMERKMSAINDVKKKQTANSVLYFFTDEQFEKFKNFLSQEPFNTSVSEEDDFVRKIKPEDLSEAEDDEEDLSDRFANLDKRQRSGDIDEPLHKVAREPEQFVEREWVVEVPKEVLEQIQDLVEEFAEEKPEKFEEAKNWYFSLNQATKEVAASEAGQVLMGVLLALGSINTPFLTNLFEATVMFSAIDYDMSNGNEQKILNLLNEDWDQKFAMKKYKDAVSDIRELKKDISDQDGDPEKVRELETLQDEAQKYRQNIQQNREQGYHDLATYYMLNQKILSPLRSKTSGKLYNVIELLVSKGDDMTVQDAVDELQKVLDYQTKNVRDIKPGKEAFLRGMKVANFALNIIQPDLAEDRMNELNTTIDTWMVRALWPGVSYSKVSSDPFAYNYLASQTAKLAREYNMLTQEMQAVIWVAMIDDDDPDSLVTAGALAEAVEDILEYIGLLSDTAEKAESIGEGLKQIADEFNNLEDFKTLKAPEMKSIFHGAAVSGKSPQDR